MEERCVKVLCGDIGGTNTRLALFEVTEGTLNIYEEGSFRSQDSSSFEEIIEQFLEEKKVVCEQACFGIAGPVKDGRCETTNLPWVIEASKLAARTHIPYVHLLNDLQANAYGISTLKKDDFIILNEGKSEAKGNLAIISAGTGLGEAGLYWDGKQHHPFACEGGHGNFGPGNELQVALLNFLFNQYGHVSWERVLSGPGFLNIYEFLCEYRSVSPSNELKEQMQKADPAAVVTKAGLSGECKICAEALDVFACLYGAEAGDLALKIMATGGVYIGGGIAPKIIEKLKGPYFMEGFLNKGRMKDLLKEIPIKVVLNDQTALLGAAQYVKTIMH